MHPFFRTLSIFGEGDFLYFGQNKCLFWSKTALLWQEVHYYIVYSAYDTELNLLICIYAQKPHICRKNSKYLLDESFYDSFCPHQKAANLCHPAGNMYRRVLQAINFR